jgi:glyoxylase-like metal-dependent hydrolase (beta-lactamase superfamily II)
VPKKPPPFEVHPIVHPSGARSYVVVEPESRESLVVDPLLDHVGDALRLATAGGGALRWIVDTHAHGDHLSGAGALHARTGADVVMSVRAESEVATRRVAEGDRLPLGEKGFRVRAAPGNAPDAIVLQSEATAGPPILFTGDTLLVGTVGVRDVPGWDGAAHYDTIQRIFEPLPDDAEIRPGHDDMGRVRTTVQAEKRGNRWMREKDREAFVSRYLADPRPVPKEAAEILAANRAGSAEPAKEALEAVEKAAGKSAERPAPTGSFVSPTGMGASTPTSAVPEGMSTLLTTAGAVSLLGSVGALLVDRWFAMIPALVAAVALGVGLSGAKRVKPKPGGGLYYLGPLPRTPTRP